MKFLFKTERTIFIWKIHNDKRIKKFTPQRKIRPNHIKKKNSTRPRMSKTPEKYSIIKTQTTNSLIFLQSGYPPAYRNRTIGPKALPLSIHTFPFSLPFFILSVKLRSPRKPIEVALGLLFYLHAFKSRPGRPRKHTHRGHFALSLDKQNSGWGVIMYGERPRSVN